MRERYNSFGGNQKLTLQKFTEKSIFEKFYIKNWQNSIEYFPILDFELSLEFKNIKFELPVYFLFFLVGGRTFPVKTRNRKLETMSIRQ